MSSVLVDAVPLGAAHIAVPVQNPAPPPGKGEEFGKASPVALVVIIALALVTVVLIRSMSKRIRRLPASFDPPAPPAEKREGKAGDPADGGGA